APEHSEEQWQLALSAASSQQGMLPGSIRTAVEQALKSKVDWRSVLNNFVETSSHSPDYHFSKVNRRYMHLGLFLPGLQGSQMRTMVIVRDTSGSVGKLYRELFNGEILDIVERMKPEELIVLDVDTQIQKVQHVLEGDIEEFDGATHGGGGTRFQPPFECVESEGIDCSCMLYLTDLHGSFPEREADYPVLWAVPEGSNRGKKPEFGDLLELELD